MLAELSVHYESRFIFFVKKCMETQFKRELPSTNLDRMKTLIFFFEKYGGGTMQTLFSLLLKSDDVNNEAPSHDALFSVMDWNPEESSNYHDVSNMKNNFKTKILREN